MYKINNALVLILLTGLPFYLHAQSEQDVFSIDFAYDADLFGTVKMNDAMAALDVWSKTFVQELQLPAGTRPRIKLHYIKNIRTILAQSVSGGYDVLNVLTTDYLKYADQSYWLPLAVSATAGHFPEAYVLLVRQESNFQQVADLHSKTLSLFGGADTSFSKLWLTVLFSEDPDHFLKQILEQEKQPGVILDVFFKKTDACVVSENVYETMCALNPQLKNQLRIIQRSPGLCKGLLCLHRDFSSQYRSVLLEGLIQLGNSGSGSQILKLFGQERLIPFAREQLTGIETLLHQSHKIHEAVR